MSVIKHDNIFYVRNVNAIGGVEKYLYELVKKYKDNDIAVVCKTIAKEQKKRLKKYCRVYIHKDEKIECKVLITNWDTSIIDYVNEDAKVYTVVHSDYSHKTQLNALPIDNPRITYICITEDSKNKFEQLSGIDRTILCRNPLTIENEEKPLILMSATRLTKEKGGHRMLALANELDRQGINYIWYVFTTNEYDNNPVWSNSNIIHMNNRLDLGYFYKTADWYVQFSEVEGDSYSLKEALYRGTPIAVCELPYFKEIGIENGKNAIYLNMDCSNVEEVAKALTKTLKFTFEPVKDDYDKIIAKGKSDYKEENMKVIAKKEFEGIRDAERNVYPKEGDIWEVEQERAEFLQSKGVVEIVKEEPELKEVKIERETLPEVKVSRNSEKVEEVIKPKKKKSKK